MATILELVQAACYEGNIAAPATLVGSTLDLSTLQLVHLTYATGRELRAARVWPQLKRTHLFFLESGRTAYRLPTDFYATLPGTEYAQDRSEPLTPLSDPEWNMRLYGIGRCSVTREFRIFGPDSPDAGQFHVTPTPSDSDAGLLPSFEDITSNWLLPKEWQAGESVTTDTVRSASGVIYKKLVATTETTGSYMPRSYAGMCPDSTVLWQFVGSSNVWTANEAYSAGEHAIVWSTGSLYRCVVGGVSGTVEPLSTTPTDIVDGSVTWRYCPVVAWAPNASFPEGTYAAPGGSIARAVIGGKSGKVIPQFTATEAYDGNVNWMWQDVRYDRILADTDYTPLDDELMIAGLKWRFLRARGLEYRDLELEYNAHKDAAVSRLTPQMKISLAGNGCWPCYPRVPQGGWSL